RALLLISWTALGSKRAARDAGSRADADTGCGPMSPGPHAGPDAGSILVDDLGLRLDHLLAAVVAVGGDVVAQVGLARGRVGGQLLGREGVVRTTHATTGRGDAGLLHSHGIAPGTIRLLLLPVAPRGREPLHCFFFSAARPAKGLVRSSSSADTGQSRSTASEPGFTGTTGMARMSSSSTRSSGRSMPSASTSSGS